MRPNDGRSLPIASGIKYVTETSLVLRITMITVVALAILWGLVRLALALRADQRIPFDAGMSLVVGLSLLIIFIPSLFRRLEILLDADREHIFISMKTLFTHAEANFPFEQASLILRKWTEPVVVHTETSFTIEATLYLQLPEHLVWLAAAEIDPVVGSAERLQTELGLPYSISEGGDDSWFLENLKASANPLPKEEVPEEAPGLLMYVAGALFFWGLAGYVWYEIQPRADDYGDWGFIGFIFLGGAFFLWRSR